MPENLSSERIDKQVKRPLCGTCKMPNQTCYCDLITPALTNTEIVLLQHPNEARHSKNTGHFLTICLPHSRVFVGEKPEDNEREIAHLLSDSCFNILLYPPTPEAESLGMYEATNISVANIKAELAVNRGIRLWCLDATWKKSRKMLYQNPWLQHLPRFSLNITLASRYTIRKAEDSHQFSTFESCCYALEQWEPNFETSKLLDSFSQFIARIGQYRPKPTRNT